MSRFPIAIGLSAFSLLAAFAASAPGQGRGEWKTVAESTLALFHSSTLESQQDGPISRAGMVGLSLNGARQAMLEMINNDRASKGLKPVALSAMAEVPAQKHAEEMAEHVFLSHCNREGKLPDQRYTESGGRDRVQENVFLATGGNARDVAPLPLLKEPLFNKKDLEAIQAAYFNQVPPYDLHRRNILDPHHTHVGIGFARAVGEKGQSLANTQEFIAKYIDPDPIPFEAEVGAAIVVSGRTNGGVELHAVELGWDELPKPKERSELVNSKPYRTPNTFVSYYPDHHEPDKQMTAQPDGRFRAVVKLSDNGKPGLYYVRIRVRAADGAKFWASQRTVVVRSAAPDKKATP